MSVYKFYSKNKNSSDKSFPALMGMELILCGGFLSRTRCNRPREGEKDENVDYVRPKLYLYLGTPKPYLIV